MSEPLVLAVGAAVLTALIVGLGPPGTDFAAHAYQRTLFARQGFDMWDNGWYAGRYEFVTYSVLYYPLAAVFGMALVAIAGQAVAVGTFAALVFEEFGPKGRWAARTFAIVWPAFVLTAAFPSALGIMLALLALRALQRGRTARACATCALTLAASPLAFLLLTVLLAAIALGNRVRGRRLVYPALTVLVLGAFEVLLWRMFPSQGRSQFAFGRWSRWSPSASSSSRSPGASSAPASCCGSASSTEAPPSSPTSCPRRSGTASRAWSSRRFPWSCLFSR